MVLSDGISDNCIRRLTVKNVLGHNGNTIAESNTATFSAVIIATRVIGSGYTTWWRAQGNNGSGSIKSPSPLQVDRQALFAHADHRPRFGPGHGDVGIKGPARHDATGCSAKVAAILIAIFIHDSLNLEKVCRRLRADYLMRMRCHQLVVAIGCSCLGEIGSRKARCEVAYRQHYDESRQPETRLDENECDAERENIDIKHQRWALTK